MAEETIEELSDCIENRSRESRISNNQKAIMKAGLNDLLSSLSLLQEVKNVERKH